MDRRTHQSCRCEDWPASILSSSLLLLTCLESLWKALTLRCCIRNKWLEGQHGAARCLWAFAVEPSYGDIQSSVKFGWSWTVCSKVSMRRLHDHVRIACLEDCLEEWVFFHLWLPSSSSRQPWHRFWSACLRYSILLTFWCSVHVYFKWNCHGEIHLGCRCRKEHRRASKRTRCCNALIFLWTF